LGQECGGFGLNDNLLNSKTLGHPRLDLLGEVDPYSDIGDLYLVFRKFAWK
jgi:hypothetical protein